MKAHVGTIIATALAAITCGATFLFALFQQFGLVEVAASMAAGVEVYLLSSSIGDLLEDRDSPNRFRLAAAWILAACVVSYFLIMRYRSPATA